MLYVLPWGYVFGPTWFNDNSIFLFAPTARRKLSSAAPRSLAFISPKIPAIHRIGPHNIDVISVIIGNMLGDGWAENRSNNTRFHIHMGSPNVEYLMWLHKFFSERGYCSSIKPQLKKNINKGNIVYFSYKFRTWTFSNLNWIYHAFYNYDRPRANGAGADKKKIIPINIEELLTPLALAIWIMDDGGVHPSGMILSASRTYNFNCPRANGAGANLDRQAEHILLQTAFLRKFDINSTIQTRPGGQAGLILYIPKNQLSKLSTLVKQYMIPCMYYKLNGY